MAKNILLFGGAFDPVHFGHVLTARLALDKTEVEFWDEVWFMPCYINLFKRMQASPEDRLVMLELAIKETGDQRLKIFDYEIRNRLESGTYVVVRKILEDKEYEGYSFGFLMGLDQAKLIRSWRNSRKFAKLLPIVVVGRFPMGGWVPTWRWYRQHPNEFVSPEINKNLSSTNVRDSVSIGDKKSTETHCGPLVAKYIDENNLYSEPEKYGSADLF